MAERASSGILVKFSNTLALFPSLDINVAGVITTSQAFNDQNVKASSVKLKRKWRKETNSARTGRCPSIKEITITAEVT